MDCLKFLGIEDLNPGAAWEQQYAMLENTKRLASNNPTDNSLIASVACCDQATYEKIVISANQNFQIWRKLPAPKRGEAIRLIANALREKKEYLGYLVSLEMGKSLQEGLGEVQEMIDIADFAVGQSRMLYGLTMHSERQDHRMYEQWHPYGIVGVISAFNFPVAVWAWNAFIAAICGNVTIWKPSSKTPLCAVAVHKICDQVLRENDFPAIFSYFIPEDHATAEAFLNDRRVPLISFTGSTAVGRKAASLVAARLGNSILELGGNNAIIVDQTADLKLAIPAIVFGAVGTAGQRCTSTRRVFIQKDRYQEVLDSLRKAYQQLRIGDPLDASNHMGPLIDQAAVECYASVLQDLKNQGAEIICGGKVLDQKGCFVEPTIVTNVENHWPLVQEETFAPILYVMPYDTLDDALAMQNGVNQGLSSAIFTKDLCAAEMFLSARGSDCGIANVNIGTSGAEIGGAFGGEKDTGGGRESGSDSWKAYMRRQTNTINWGRGLPLSQGIKFDI